MMNSCISEASSRAWLAPRLEKKNIGWLIAKANEGKEEL
jgi:hypothetical protein